MKTTDTIKIKAVCAVCALALLAGVASAKVVNDTVAAVNGEPILRSEYESNVVAVTEQYRRAMPEFFEQKDAQSQIEKKVLDQMIDDLLLIQQANASKIKIRDRELDNAIDEVKKSFSYDEAGRPLDEKAAQAAFDRALSREGLTMEKLRERKKKQLTVRKYIDEYVRPKIKPPEPKAVAEFFEQIKLIIKGDTTTLKGLAPEDAQGVVGIAQHLKEITSERVKVRHILIKVDEKSSLVDKNAALKKAQDIKKELDGGADFSELARKYSQDAESAQRGGDIGYIIRGWMPAEFEKEAFSLPVGEAGGPVETKFGYHLIRVDEKRASQSLSLDDVKDDLAQYMAGRDAQKELIRLVGELKKKASIQVSN